MKKTRYIFAAACIIFQVALMFAGPATGTPVMEFQQVFAGNDLNKESFECMLQDYKGYIWMGGRKGLFCAIGNSMSSYMKSADTLSLPENAIRCLYEDSKKRLWVGTEYGNIALYNRGQDNFTRVPTSAMFRQTSVFSIIEIGNEQFYIATAIGLFVLDARTFAIGTIESGISTRAFYRLNKSEILVATEEKGILLINTIKGKVIKQYKLGISPGGSSTRVYCFSGDKNGTVWAAGNNGQLWWFNRVNDSFESIPVMAGGKKIHDELLNLFHDAEGNFWISGINTGLIMFDTKRKSTVQYKTDCKNQVGLTSNTITCLMQDSSKWLWVATQRGGVVRYAAGLSAITRFMAGEKNSHFVSNNMVSTFSECPDGNILVGTDGGGLNLLRVATQTFKYYSVSEGLADNAVTDIAKDKKGYFWVSMWNGGVAHLRVEGDNIIDLQENIACETTKGVMVDSRGWLWIASINMGVMIYDPSTRLLYSKNNPGTFCKDIFVNRQVIDFFEDASGDIWVCSYQGLDRISTLSSVVRYMIPEFGNKRSLYVPVISMIQTRDHKIWALTSEQLIEFNESTNTFEACGAKYKLQGVAQGMVETANGHLWLSSSTGLVDFDPAKQQYTVFNHDYGTFVERASLISTDGIIYFGSTNGFICFDSREMNKTQAQSPTEIIGLYIFNQKQKPGTGFNVLKKNITETRSLAMPYNLSVFSLEYSTLTFSNSAKTSYRYHLNGFDKNWVYVTGETKATYTNLDPGVYSFEVCSSNDKLTWSSPRLLSIEIVPPWWKTPLFKISVVIAIVLGTWILYVLRTRSFKRKNSNLERAVRERTSDLLEANSLLLERNEEIRLQKEHLEELNNETQRQTHKILRQQDELIEKKNSLENSNKELTALNETKDKLFSIIAHDLRNPVNALLNFSELMDTHVETYNMEKIKTFIGYIRMSSQSINDLLINLLDWSRVKSETMKCVPRNVSVNDIVENVKILAMQQALNKNQTFTVKHEGSISAWCDSNMIETVVRNLVSNAIKFTPKNGTISINTLTYGSCALVEVTDNGIGMDKNKINKLFDTNYETSKGTNNEVGTGLGLVICKDFIEKNQGTISVKSEVSKGTTFTIAIPLTQPLTADTYKTSIRQPEHVTPNNLYTDDKLLINKKILIIDDDEMMRNVLRNIFSNICELTDASNGVEALEIIENGLPDIIISDIHMPIMNGIELCSIIKNQKNTCHIPVILLTAENDDKTHIKSLEEKADAYLSKPVNTRMLFAVISNLIKSREMLRKQFVSEFAMPTNELTKNDIDAQLIERLIAFIEANITNGDLNADDLTTEAGISKTILYAKLKNITGQTVNEFIRTIRIKRSVRYLLQKKHNINEIADLCGFNSTSYYIRSFNKIYGMSPTEYVEKLS